MSKQIAKSPESIAYLQELQKYGWEDPHLCLAPTDNELLCTLKNARDRIVADLELINAVIEQAAQVAERREAEVQP